MDKKNLIVVIICAAIFLGWERYYQSKWPAPPPSASEEKSSPAQTNLTSTTTPALPQLKAAPTPLPEPAKPAAGVDASKPKPAEQTVLLENDFMRATLTSYGGGIRTVVLKKWTVSHANSQLVTLNQYGPEPVLAFSDLPGADASAVYNLESKGADHATVSCETPGGLRVIKEFQITQDYLITCRVRFENTGKALMQTGGFGVAVGTSGQLDALDDPTLVNVDHWNGSSRSLTGRAQPIYGFVTPLFFLSTMFGDQMSVAKEEFADKNPVKWASASDRYFTLVLTASDLGSGFRARKVELPAWVNPKASTPPLGGQGWMLFDSAKVESGASVAREFQLYAGPKEFHQLSMLGSGQEEIMNFGWFGRIAQLLLWTLIQLHGLIPNYGVAIIIITIIIKLLFWPAQAISTRSMKQMQAIQPLLAKLKEKYPDNPQKLQEETMRIYREHKVSPLGGCLPMLVQIPVFVAFYNMLRPAIELRGAHFLWVRDLSQPDTILTIAGVAVNPLPLIMGLTMLWQQKLTPATNADPAQQKMMMFMPLMFLFMMYSSSSGLLLYWTAQNLLSILQQWLALRDNKGAGTPPGLQKAASR